MKTLEYLIAEAKAIIEKMEDMPVAWEDHYYTRKRNRLAEIDQVMLQRSFHSTGDVKEAYEWFRRETWDLYWLSRPVEVEIEVPARSLFMLIEALEQLVEDEMREAIYEWSIARDKHLTDGCKRVYDEAGLRSEDETLTEAARKTYKVICLWLRDILGEGRD